MLKQVPVIVLRILFGARCLWGRFNMQLKVIFLLLFGSSYAAPHEGLPLLHPGGIGGIFKGPDSETIIVGPDGSEITSEQKGGAVLKEDGLSLGPIIAAEPKIVQAPVLSQTPVISYVSSPIISSTEAPILASAVPHVVSPGPILSSSPAPLLPDVSGPAYVDLPLEHSVAPVSASVAPILATGASVVPVHAKPIEIIEQDPHIIETEIIEAPDVEPDQSSDLKGPSGRIITKGSASVVSGPASTTITEPRKIIVAPPKIAIGTPVIAHATIPLREVAPLPVVTASTVSPLPKIPYKVSSTVAPPILSYSTSEAPVDLGYSTASVPINGLPSAAGYESAKIDLGGSNYKEYVPVVEYGSSKGIISGRELVGYSSTEAPIISSTISSVTTENYAPIEGLVEPAAYLVAPPAPTEEVLRAEGFVSSTASPNIQRIPKLQDNIAIDGKVDMGYPISEKSALQTYHLPHVLSTALSRFYRKVPIKNKDTIVIDDKMGEWSKNEIGSYEIQSSFIPPPNLSKSSYLGPALAKHGIDASQVQLTPVHLSEVTKLLDGAYPRYERQAKP